MVKLLFALIVIISSCLVGNSFSVKLINRRKTLESIVNSINRAKTLICFGGMDIRRVVKECFCTDEFPLLDTELLKSDDFDSSFKDSVNKINSVFSLTKADKELFIQFGSKLGMTDVTGQVAHAELYGELFGERLRQVKAQENEKSKLYRILGFSIGSAISLLIA